MYAGTHTPCLFVAPIPGSEIELRCVDDGGHALCEEHSRQRYDERLYLQIRYQITLNKSESGAYSEGYENRGHYIAPAVVEVHCTAHTYQRRNSADRDVDTAGYHYKAHSAGEDYQSRVFVEYVEEGLHLREAGTDERHSADIHYNEYRNGDDQKQIRVR